MRIGIGWDRHRLIEGRPCVLGGVLFDDCPVGPKGHSDGDAVLHAIVDALLGAAALGDIGKHFPDTSAQYYGVSSRIFLEGAKNLLCDAGYKTNNIDVTIITEQPYLSKRIDEMQNFIASVLDIDINDISVKGTRGEGLGPEGRSECVTAMAVATIKKV